MDFETFLSYFPEKPRDKIKDGYNVLCPSHPDKQPSLSIAQVEDKILLHCKAGCETENIVASLGLEMADLFTNKNDIKHKIVAEYSYKDELGNLLFQVVRYEPKSFAQRHRNSNGEWVWNLTGVRRVLYHLPEILQETGIIYLTEGEGDADKLWEWGQVATTSPGGANNWRPEYADCLIGKRIVVIPDKDKAGYGYARSVIKSLEGKARETKCIILPGDDVKDFSDWIRRENDIAKLPFLEQDISLLFEIDKPHYQQKEGGIIWQKPGQSIIFKANELAQQRTGIHSRISIYLDYKPLAWTLCNIERAEERIRLANSAYSYLKIKDYTKEDLRRDLDIFCLGLWDYHLSTISPEMMIGDETQDPPTFYLHPYILAEGGSILFSPPGRGKSNTALAWGQSINYGISKLWKVQKAPVLYINLERSAQTLRRRLANVNKILGLPASHPLLTINARGKSLIDVAPIIRKSIKQYDIKLIILDSITRAGLGDLTENQPVNRIIDTLSGLCPTWLALGHTPRASEEHIFGAVMFEAGADIVIQLRSQIVESKLGIGYEIVKANELPHFKQEIYAFEFNKWNLDNIRKARAYEFSEIESKSKTHMLDNIKDFVLDNGEATTAEIEEALGYNRANISTTLNHSGEFVKTRKQGRNQYYGVKI